MATVFYAWQSDRNPKVCRHFIRDAIERAIKAVKRDGEIDDAPELDYDTKGSPGTPHIAETIFEKIRNCGIFVADVTFVGATDGATQKLVPNPNVLIELGEAAATVGWERIFLVMNTAFGPPNELPFDLRHRSFPTQYELKDESDAQAKQVRDALAKELETRIRRVLDARVIEKAAEAKRVVSVTCQMALAGVGNPPLQLFCMTVVNRGQRPVTIAQAGIVFSDGRVLIPAQSRLGPWSLPRKLDESDKVDIYANAVDIRAAFLEAQKNGQSLSILRAYVKDTLGNAYESDSLERFTIKDFEPLKP